MPVTPFAALLLPAVLLPAAAMQNAGSDGRAVTVALMQLARPPADRDAAMRAASEAVAAAVDRSAGGGPRPDLCALPAGWLQGGMDASAYCALASAHKVALVGTALDGGNSSAVLCTADGVAALTYTKPRGTASEPTAGDPPTATVSLGGAAHTSTALQVQVGLLLDTDHHFMEPARTLMLKGTQLVVHSLDEAPERGDTRMLFWQQRDNAIELAVIGYADAGNVAPVTAAFPTSPKTGNACYYSEAQGNQPTAAAQLDPCLLAPPGEPTTAYYTTAPLSPDLGVANPGDPESSRRPFDYQPLCFADQAERARRSALTPWRGAGEGGDGAPDAAVTAKNAAAAAADGSASAHAARRRGDKDTVTVALLQLVAAVGQDPLNASAAKAEARVREAARAGADVALLPELWSVGYMGNEPGGGWGPDTDANFQSYGSFMRWATPPDGPYVQRFRALAKELGIAIALPILRASHEEPGGVPVPPKNTVVLIDRFGRVVYVFSKVHIAWGGGNGGDVEGFLSAGRGFYGGQLDVAGVGNVSVCSIICYDREHPEAARACAATGAEIMLVPTACGVDYAAVDLVATRAKHNAMAVAMTNYGTAPGKSPLPNHRGHAGTYYCSGVDCNGLSLGVDHAGNVVKVVSGDPGSAGAGAEGVFPVTFNVTALRDYRASPRGRALETVRTLRPELCRIPTSPRHQAAACNAHRMWL